LKQQALWRNEDCKNPIAIKECNNPTSTNKKGTIGDGRNQTSSQNCANSLTSVVSTSSVNSEIKFAPNKLTVSQPHLNVNGLTNPTLSKATLPVGDHRNNIMFPFMADHSTSITSGLSLHSRIPLSFHGSVVSERSSLHLNSSVSARKEPNFQVCESLSLPLPSAYFWTSNKGSDFPSPKADVDKDLVRSFYTKLSTNTIKVSGKRRCLYTCSKMTSIRQSENIIAL